MDQKLIGVDIAYSTDAGGRDVNQDSVGFEMADDTYCLTVADGVGGYHYGEYASQLATAYIRKAFLLEPVVQEAALRRHMTETAGRVMTVIAENPALRSMRTTLTAVYLNGKRIVAGHIGDSRIYIIRDGEILYCSQDHSLVMNMVLSRELGVEDIRNHPKRNVITSSIGGNFPKHLDVVSFDMIPTAGDGLLLCSDGFWELITDEEMLEFMGQSSSAGQWLMMMESRVGNRQSKRSDNYTCLAVRFIANE